MGLWSITHFWGIIPAFIVFAVIAVVLGFTLKNKDERIKIWILRGFAILIIALEIMKQKYSYFRDGGYDFYSLPFHYCSLFLYLLPLHSFSTGKLRKFINGITFGTTASLFLFFLIVPTVLYPAGAITSYFESFSSFHTVTFHHLVVLYLFLAIAFKQFDLSFKKDFPIMAIFLSAYVIVATILSYALKVNYQNILKCNLDAIENIRLMMINAIGGFGQAIYIFVLFIMTTIFGYIAYSLVYLFYNFVITRKKKQKSN